MLISGEELLLLLDDDKPLKGIEIGLAGAHTSECLLSNLKNLT